MDVERRHQHMHWIKHFNLLKKFIMFITYFLHAKNVSIIVIHNVIIISTTVGCVFSASCSKYAFQASTFSAQQTLTRSYFRQTILGLVGDFPLGSQVISGGGVQVECPGVHVLK